MPRRLENHSQTQTQTLGQRQIHGVAAHDSIHSAVIISAMSDLILVLPRNLLAKKDRSETSRKKDGVVTIHLQIGKAAGNFGA